jgi:hypothetical protein
MTSEQDPIASGPEVSPVQEQRLPDNRPVGQPVSQVDWFRSAPNGGTVFVSADD